MGEVLEEQCDIDMDHRVSPRNKKEITPFRKPKSKPFETNRFILGDIVTPHTHTHAHTHTRTRPRTHTHLHTHLHTLTHLHIHTYTYTCTLGYTPHGMPTYPLFTSFPPCLSPDQPYTCV